MGFKYIKDWIMRKKGHGIFMVCVEYFFRTIVVVIMPIERLSSHMWWTALVVGWSEGVFRFQIHSGCCHSLEREARMIVWGKKNCLFNSTNGFHYFYLRFNKAQVTVPTLPDYLCVEWVLHLGPHFLRALAVSGQVSVRLLLLLPAWTLVLSKFPVFKVHLSPTITSFSLL